MSRAILPSLLGLSLLMLVSGTTSVCADPTTEINALLEPIREKHRLPALAAAVFDTSGLLGQGATGIRKAGQPERVTTRDHWHLGSETKAMTATLAGCFVADGRLTWNDTMSQHFPEFADEIAPPLRGVTLAQLLSHRAGLTPNLAWSEFETRNLPEARRKASKQLLTRPPAGTVGQYLYSNAGYVVAGAILEKVGGKPWEQLLTERIFKPLEMKSAGFGGVGTVAKTDQPWGHRDDGSAVESNGPKMDNAPVMGPAGTVHSSLADWTKFLTDQLRGGTGSKALLPAEVYQAIHAPHPADATYGLGWGLAERPWAGGKTLSHNGSNTMNLAVCWIALPKKFGVIVCTNQAGETATKAADEAVGALIRWHRERP